MNRFSEQDWYRLLEMGSVNRAVQYLAGFFLNLPSRDQIQFLEAFLSNPGRLSQCHPPAIQALNDMLSRSGRDLIPTPVPVDAALLPGDGSVVVVNPVHPFISCVLPVRFREPGTLNFVNADQRDLIIRLASRVLTGFLPEWTLLLSPSAQTIFGHYSIPDDSGESEERVEGDSMILPLVMFLISYLIQKPIPSDMAFTGHVSEDGRLLPVSHIPDKASILADEQPHLTRLIVPATSDVGKSLKMQAPIIFPLSSLDDVVSLCWPEGIQVPGSRQMTIGREKTDSMPGALKLSLAVPAGIQYSADLISHFRLENWLGKIPKEECKYLLFDNFRASWLMGFIGAEVKNHCQWAAAYDSAGGYYIVFYSRNPGSMRPGAQLRIT
ncbi:MAG: hypothetical protein HUU10_12995 [Bacteroidetes bacterium]|nr:hypothetical protein [Bacteroidota bacterium]